MVEPVPPFAPAVLAIDPARRRPLLEVLAAGLRSVEPAGAVRRALRRDGSWLALAGEAVDLAGVHRVIVLAFGKAAAPMAAAVEQLMNDRPLEGLVLTSVAPPDLRLGLPVVLAGHPLPDPASEEGATRLLELARSAGPGDLVVTLVSGGGSSLCELPAPGLTRQDLVDTGAVLLARGATIGHFNTVRKHLSAVKGGRLAAAAAPARMLTLVLSDVVGSPLDVIASGPTVPDPTTYRQALEVVEGLGCRLPARVMTHLREGAAGRRPETPKGGPAFDRQTVVVVADGATAARVAAQAAVEMGLPAPILDLTVEGPARQVGRRLAERLVRLRGPGLLIGCGETTVALEGGGTGGRNQELALAAAVELDGDPRMVVAAFGTDGIDGPTDAAGGLVDGGTVERGRRQGLDAGVHLTADDAYPFLEASGDLLRTGPTGTNVGDLLVAYRRG